jgi:tripartite-type tricarboxylate transporter receptor subunit TctC
MVASEYLPSISDYFGSTWAAATTLAVRRGRIRKDGETVKTNLWALLGVLSMAQMAGVAPSAAQDNAPIRLIVGFAPGGSTDLVARLMAQKLGSQLNTNVVVDNRVGANTNIAAGYVARATPNGHTLLFNAPSQILSRAFGEKLDYDVFKDLTPLALYATAPQVLVVHPSVPGNTAAEFIAHIRSNPDKLAYGSAGTGSIIHLGALLFLQMNGLNALHVPYKGGAPAMIDLVGGRIQFTMQSTTTVLPMVRDKRIKALAIASLKRSPLLPDVPTLAETVMPKFEIGSWTGVMAPARTPAAMVKKLNAEILKTLNDADMKARLAQDGIEPLGSTPEQYGAYLKHELERWSKVIKTAGVKPE